MSKIRKNYTPKSKTTKKKIYTIFSIQNPHSISKTTKIMNYEEEEEEEEKEEERKKKAEEKEKKRNLRP